ncbi:hypothetical protein FisN_12Hh159 [Fistulifera solaris]|uniref:GOST seven transmembrane domain-containing protein n=1 Tax=Fistulifera solaris TaxID=1519565 RepID=A0A1Z5KBC8_FISSO|nr:hypothetical protein FisN_12Hh159 [Fistulifera solaris]|eukprot:GAX23593.1 hypothetical protein FisN_12Hh159 [Fistulifera solaris]
MRLLLILATTLFFQAHAEVMPFNVLLKPDESTIHYYEGYIRAPGFIDLSDLTFNSDHNNFIDPNSAFTDDSMTDDEYVNDDSTRRRLDGGIETDGTAVDILVFRLPEKCASSRKGCDYTDLGVGGRADDGTLRWCCSNDAIDKGLCDRDQAAQYGRIIVDKSKYTGDSRYVNIPSAGDVSKRIKLGKLDQREQGHYVVVMANCDPSGRPVAVKGNMIWKSEHGYLPGQLFGIMWFYIYVTLGYIAFVLWYGISMIKNKESRIPIEKWILATICLGLVESFYQAVHLLLWNGQGYPNNLLAYLTIFTGSFKQGVSRCLAVMVGLGWGVVRDSLGSTMRTIVILGTAYTATSVFVDLIMVFAIEDIQTLSESKEENLFQLASLLTFVLAVLDVVFFMWMLDALNNTMEYLENMNQTRKLERYLQLRQIFLFTILASVIWAIFSVVDTFGESGILLEENEWMIEGLKELIYTGALLGVAILWRPNPNAKEYAYVMELRSDGDDLELSGVVPSALDDDDEFESSHSAKANGFSDGPYDHHTAELS